MLFLVCIHKLSLIPANIIWRPVIWLRYFFRQFMKQKMKLCLYLKQNFIRKNIWGRSKFNKMNNCYNYFNNTYSFVVHNKQICFIIIKFTNNNFSLSFSPFTFLHLITHLMLIAYWSFPLMKTLIKYFLCRSLYFLLFIQCKAPELFIDIKRKKKNTVTCIIFLIYVKKRD